MVFKFKMPDIGEGLQEGEIVKWLVSEGDSVTEDQPIAEVMTDKATVELPAPRTGKIKKILHGEGTVVPVGEVFVEIEESGDAEAEEEEEEKPKAKKGKKEKKAEAEEEAEEEGKPKKEEKEEKMLFESKGTAGGSVTRRKKREEAAVEAGNGARDGKVLAAPATRRLARELDVDISRIEGSGPKGRVTKDDVEAFAEGGEQQVVTTRERPKGVAAAPEELEERVQLKGLRRVIANAMQHAKNTAAHYTYVEEVDASNLVEIRERAKKLAQDRGLDTMSYLPFFVKATVAALKRHPQVNVAYDEESNELVYKKYYHIGIAVATDAGLVVPVVRDADKKSMFEIQEEIQELADKTREGEASSDELRGSTFTITSLGKTGGLLATPVLNMPEVGIMGVHAIKDKPVIKKVGGEAKIVPGKVMNLSWTFDHRFVDGAVGAEFAQTLIEYIENPELLVLEG
ncbi:MAG: 2-oxo acid dehydrogenase subunit E2 [Euryarchaeota archaeon]|nr:2-oxo acid dehydrogenase subunit E2 [Euryarchaeota archaeon]